jgi:hypothetical protein
MTLLRLPLLRHLRNRISLKVSVSASRLYKCVTPLQVRKNDFLDSDEEDGPKTHHLKSASGILQSEPMVEDWFFDNIIRPCDYDMHFDVLKSAFSDWSSEDDGGEQKPSLSAVSQIVVDARGSEEL